MLLRNHVTRAGRGCMTDQACGRRSQARLERMDGGLLCG